MSRPPLLAAQVLLPQRRVHAVGAGHQLGVAPALHHRAVLSCVCDWMCLEWCVYIGVSRSVVNTVCMYVRVYVRMYACM